MPRARWIGPVILLFAAPAGAETLVFRGIAATSCALLAPVDGVISLQGDLRSWLTTVPATINVTNTAPATVTVTPPTSWTSSPAGTPATTFAHVATMTGTNLGTLTGGGTGSSGILTALGITILSVSLTATASTAFRAGAHEARVTVTCTVP